MIIVGIPTMSFERALPLINQIRNGEVLPDKVFVYNNSNQPVLMPFGDGIVHVINNMQNLGVNPVWNQMMDIADQEGAHCTLLNDDIKIKPYFFRKIKTIMDHASDLGILAPVTTNDLKAFEQHPESNGPPNLSVMGGWRKRRGWAFTIHRDFIHYLPRIPSQLKYFCGDDWIWKQAEQYHQACVQDNTNLIWHQVGATTAEHPEIRSLLNQEKREFNKLWGL